MASTAIVTGASVVDECSSEGHFTQIVGEANEEIVIEKSASVVQKAPQTVNVQGLKKL